MKSLERNYNNIVFGLLLLISLTLIFRQFSTILILVLVGFSALFYKKLEFTKQKLVWIAIIAAPFLLDVIFMWNNDSLYEGYKSLEKRLSLLFFPLIVLLYPKEIPFKKFVRIYAWGMVLLLLVLFIRYAFIRTDELMKYLGGTHLWEMGYSFSKSFGMHAPALNMHLSFVSICCLYCFFNRKSGVVQFLINALFVLLSFATVAYVNTRVAVVTTILGYVVVCFFEIFKKQNIRKALKISLILFVLIAVFLVIFVKVFPYSVKKYTEGSFADMEYVGRLDEIENPEARVFSKLVTRVSIWKSAAELAADNWVIGLGAADAKKELINYYKKTNQRFLAKYEFPVHNQYLDFGLKFGITGTLVVLLFMGGILFLGFKQQNPVMIAFGLLFLVSNLTDDFLIRYDGITFAGLWFALFAKQYCNKQ